MNPCGDGTESGHAARPGNEIGEGAGKRVFFFCALEPEIKEVLSLGSSESALTLPDTECRNAYRRDKITLHV